MLLGGGGKSELFAFSSFTFKTHLTYGSNTAGDYGLSDGYQGSTYSQLTSMSHYQNNGSTWYNDTNFFRMNTRGYQEWRVPANGNYKIKCMGAGGGNGGYGPNNWQNRGGYGSYAEKTFALVKGDWLQIIVGHCGKNVDGSSSQGSGGGGGGSFVLKSSTGSFSTSNLILAGGGGGGGAHPPNAGYNYGVGADGGLSAIQGVASPVSSRSVGTYGGGAGYSTSVGSWGGGDGAGFLTNGYSSERESGSFSTNGMGKSWSNGLEGGNGEPFTYEYGHNGGFGGGGAASWAAGGGGGYCGGPGDYSTGSGSDTQPDGPQAGGAGGLYYTGSTTTLTTGNNTIVDHGYVEVTKLS